MRTPSSGIVHRRHQRAHPLGHRARDLVLVVTLAAACVWLTGSARAPESITREQLSLYLTVTAGAVALAVAVLWALVARLAQDGRPVWAAAAFAVYGLVAVPATTLGSALETGRATTGAIRLTAHAVVVLMLLACVTRVARRTRTSGLGLFWMGALISLAAGGLAPLDAETAFAVTTSPPVRWTVVVAWLLAGLLIAVRPPGVDLASAYRSGLGVIVLAAAHGLRIETEPAQPVVLPNLTFCAVRLFALTVILVGALQLARNALHRLGEAQREHEQQLRLAEDGLARLAERDHELRNGIAGLAGAAGLLGGCSDGDEAQLRSAAAAEIARLDALLSPPVHDPVPTGEDGRDGSATVRDVVA